MKLRLNSILRRLILASMLVTVGYSVSGAAQNSYVVEGVNAGDIMASERFYDNGKGYYWETTGLYQGAQKLYKENGDMSFLGDLEDRVNKTNGITSTTFDPLMNDSDTCWYNVAANVIQYWQSYYGVFYTGSDELIYGHTYDKEYADDLGGTQSLKLGMYMYDNFPNVEGNITTAADAYLKTYFNEHFNSYSYPTIKCTYVTGYSIWEFQDALSRQLGLKEQWDGSYVQTEFGNIVSLSIGHWENGERLGHALTCYGFTVDEYGTLISIKVANSDDIKYELFDLYVSNKSGKLMLYEDAACENKWKYASKDWELETIDSIITPTTLRDMYKKYISQDVPLVWTGAMSVWQATQSASISDALPDANSGWDVSIGGKYYHIYADSTRKVLFDDHASRYAVEVRGTVSTPELQLGNNCKDYTFTGTQSATIQTGSLVTPGSGFAEFRNMQVTGSSLELNNYTLSLGSGSSLIFDSATLSYDGCLRINGGSASIGTLTLSESSKLEIAANGSLTATTVSAASDVHFVFSESGALLTFSGALTLDAPIAIDYLAGNSGQTYALITFDKGLNNWDDYFTSEYGTLSYGNNTLYLTFVPIAQLQWANASGTWSASSWNNTATSSDKSDVYFIGSTGGVVTIQGEVKAHSVSVNDGSYTFTGGVGAAINGAGSLTVRGDAELISSVPIENTPVHLYGSGILNLSGCGTTSLYSIAASESSTLRLTNGTNATLNRIASLGTVSVDATSTLTLAAAEDLTLSGQITSAGTVNFNKATGAGNVTYTLQQVSSSGGFTNTVNVASGVTLSLPSITTEGCIYNLADDSTLILRDGCVISEQKDKPPYASIQGTGTLIVEESATPVMVDYSYSGFPALSADVKLDVRGAMVYGGTYTGHFGTRVLTKSAVVSGSLTINTMWTRTTALTLGDLTLEGGTTSFLMNGHSSSYPYDIEINKLNVSGDGGKLLMQQYVPLYGGAYPYNDYHATIGELSGRGTVTIAGDSPFSPILFRLNSVGSDGFDGKLIVQNEGMTWDAGYLLQNGTFVELGEMNMKGSIFINTFTPCTEDRANALFFTALGITGDVTIGGLDTIESPVTRVYLYSGSVGDNGVRQILAEEELESYITPEEYTLTIDTEETHRFAGKVCSDLSLCKQGSGSQYFTGEIGTLGTVEVKGGILNFSRGITADNISVRNAALVSGGRLAIDTNFDMYHATLSADSLVCSTGEFTGANRITTNSITGTDWVLNLTKMNLDTPVLTLACHGSIQIDSLQVIYDSNDMYSADFALVQYCKDAYIVGNAFSQLEGTYLKEEVINGVAYYTLMYQVNDGALTPPRSTAATLTWKGGSGTWAEHAGHNEGVWLNDKVTNRNFYAGDTVVFNTAATVSLEGKVNPAAVEVKNTSGNVSFIGNGEISGATRLTKSGSGTLSISTANSYSGGTVISGGSLTVGNTKALGSGSVTLQSGTLDMNDKALTNALLCSGTATIQNGNQYAGQLTVTAGTLRGAVNLSSQASIQGGRVEAVLSGSGSVSITGTATLAGANTYTGGTVLNNGALTIAHDSALGTGSLSSSGSSSLTVAKGCTLHLNSIITNSGNLSLSGNFDVSDREVEAQTWYMGLNGERSQSGFKAQVLSLNLTTGEGTLDASNAQVYRNGQRLEVGTDGCISHIEKIEYGSFRVGPYEEASVSEITRAAADHGADSTDIDSYYGTLTMDTSVQGNLTMNGGTLVFTGKEVDVHGTLSLKQTVTIQLGDSYLQSGTYTLLSLNGFDGNCNQFILDIPEYMRVEAELSYDAANRVLQLVTQKNNQDLTWNGGKGSVWNAYEDGSEVWVNEAGVGADYVDGDDVRISSPGTVTIAGVVNPGSIKVSADGAVTISSDKRDYGYICGSGSLFKTGSGVLTINTEGYWYGAIHVSEGTLKQGVHQAFGFGDITVTNGATLDFGNKYAGNTIYIKGSALIKGGTKYEGTLILDGDLLKGSSISLSSWWTAQSEWKSGTVYGTISGSGTLQILGNATLGDTGKLDVGMIHITSGGLDIGLKGLAMNRKDACLAMDGGYLTSAGKLSGYNLTMTDGATLTVSNAKPMAASFKGAVSAEKNSTLTLYGAFTAAELDLTDSTFTLEMDSRLIDAKNQPKAQSVTINGKGTDSCLDDSEMEVAGKMSVTGNLKLKNDSSLILYDPSGKNAAMPLAVKGTLGMTSESELSLNGKLSAASLNMKDADITLSNEKAQSIALTMATDAQKRAVNNTLNNSRITANASMSVAGNLELSGASSIHLWDANTAKPKALNLAVKGTLDMTAESELSLNGKLSAASLNMKDADITLSNEKAQSIALSMAKDAQKRAVNNTLNNSRITANASMSVAGNLELSGASSIHLWDANTAKPKALNLAVKGNLTVGSGSSLTLSGALSAANLTLDGGCINLTGTKPQTIKVSNQLAINSGTDIKFNFNVTAKDANKKAFKILTFKTIGEYVEGDFVAWTDEDESISESLLELLGLENAGCTLTLDVKKKNISLTVTDLVAWEAAMEDGEDDAASEETPTPTALAALPVVPDFSPVADALVQANWGQVEASRAFVNAIGSRSMAVQLGSGERAVWASAIGASSRHSAAGGHNGADTNVTGGALGVETQLGESSLLGVALGASRTRVSAHNYGTIKQDTTHLGLYGQTNWNKLSADWSAAYGRSDSEIHGSSWKQNHLQLDGRVSYNHALSSSTVLRGFGGMQYYASDSATVDGIETGSIQNLRAEIGVGASHAIGKLGVYGEVAVHQNLVRHNPTVTTPDARYRGMNPGRTGLNFTVGASYSLTDQWSVNASYTGEIVENANAHSANVGATYKF